LYQENSTLNAPAAAATAIASSTSLASAQRHRPKPWVQAYRKVPVSSSRASTGATETKVLTGQLAGQQPSTGSQASPGPAAPAAPLAARLSGIPGVEGVVVVRADPRLTIPAAFHNLGAQLGSTGPVPAGVSDLSAESNATDHGYQQLANTVILVSLPIAGCTLAVGIAAGLADRKRPFSLLRLTGARLATLRRVVALESAVPLLAAAAVAIGTGFGATAMYASVEMQRPMVAPGAAYYLLTAGGILAALGIIAATFPLLARITGPEVARNE